MTTEDYIARLRANGCTELRLPQDSYEDEETAPC